MSKIFFFSFRTIPFKYHAILLCYGVLLSIQVIAQSSKGILKGRVIDATTHRTLSGVVVASEKNQLNRTSTSANGAYSFNLIDDNHTISYKIEGFQSKIITDIKISSGEVTYLDIILYPIAQNNIGPLKKSNCKDSVSAGDSVMRNKFSSEISNIQYHFSNNKSGLINDIITEDKITPGNYKNTLLLLKSLTGVVMLNNPANQQLHTFSISGMGERYNQLIFNGSVLSSFDAMNNSYPLELLPVEAIEEVSVQKIGSSLVPSNFSGGTIELKTKDIVDKNFFYVQAGIGCNDGTTGKDFYTDKRTKTEFLGFSGSQRALPSTFPTTKSEYNLNSKNLVEQVYLSRQLKNNLVPQNFGPSKPNEKLLIGFGKKWRLKNDIKISIIGFIHHNKTEQFNQAAIQVAPNVAENPYPFIIGTQPVILSQSNDSIYNFTSQSSGVFNASIVYKKNKISFRNFLGSEFNNIYVKRTGLFKPDDDTLAHTGIRYATSQRYFINTQLAGEHILSADGGFKMDWQATYLYINQQNPDERNFLLRQSTVQTGLYEIATAAGFTKTSRQWRRFSDNNFSGSFNLSFPFNLLNQPQTLTGGICIQQNYRVFNSDILQVQGKGYATLDKLIDAEKYYPGGLTVTNFYVNGYVNPTLVQQYSRPNYSASANLGAAYIQLVTRLGNQLSLNLGGRIETNNQLVSSIYYQYFTGFRNPQFFPLDENTRVTSNYFLPSTTANWSPLGKLKISASYFKSLNRPQLQELVKYAYYDAASFMATTGNPLLSTTLVNNYSIGIQFLNNAFSHITVTGFYKKIDQPIEYILDDYTRGSVSATPHNTPPATVKGVEAAFRLKLNILKSSWLSGITIFANGNIAQSKVTSGPIRSSATPNVAEHQLTGTPDYTLNTGLVFQYARLPEITILYSRTADYITALGSGKLFMLSNKNTVLQIPDYRMKGREQLDIQISQKIIKSRLQIIAGVNNLIASPYIQYQDLNGNNKFDNPLVLKNNGNSIGGYFVSGTDNTIINVTQRRAYYITFSYLFK